MINNDIPFPIPLSVIFSPSHIAKIVPETSITTDKNWNAKGEINPGFTLERKASPGKVL
ncbi:hypothetical protein D9M70_567970 [compost metagenome]